MNAYRSNKISNPRRAGLNTCTRSGGFYWSIMGKLRKDLMGKKFGRLTVIERVENTGRTEKKPWGRPTYRCECECRKMVNVISSHLKSKHTQSCGCLGRELSSKVNKGHSNPNWNNGRTQTNAGYIYIHKPNHPLANISGYVFEHRLAMEDMIGRYLRPEEVVHHINGIVDDNRKGNLMRFDNNGEHLKYHRRGNP